jgi:hypothetical protein
MLRRDRGAAGAALAALVLAACTACAEPAAPAPSATAAASAPAFPAVRGTVITSSSSDEEWWRTVRVADSEAAYRQARQLLLDGGFVLTKDREGTGGGDGQACTTELCVSFTATDDTDAGPTVAYDVFHPTGVQD